jgi:hypothetical protein
MRSRRPPAQACGEWRAARHDPSLSAWTVLRAAANACCSAVQSRACVCAASDTELESSSPSQQGRASATDVAASLWEWRASVSGATAIQHAFRRHVSMILFPPFRPNGEKKKRGKWSPPPENLLGVPSAVLRVHISRTNLLSVLRGLTEVDLYPGFPSASGSAPSSQLCVRPGWDVAPRARCDCHNAHAGSRRRCSHARLHGP